MKDECTLRFAHACVMCSEYNGTKIMHACRLLLSRILSIVNSDWLQHACSVRECMNYNYEVTSKTFWFCTCLCSSSVLDPKSIMTFYVCMIWKGGLLEAIYVECKPTSYCTWGNFVIDWVKKKTNAEVYFYRIFAIYHLLTMRWPNPSILWTQWPRVCSLGQFFSSNFAKSDIFWPKCC